MARTLLDLTGLKCPLPALMTGKALKALAVGERLEVCCTDPLAIIDIPVLIQQTGNTIEATERRGDIIVFLIAKRNGAIADSD
ncbi:MAG: sulfurtransferase TusA family protein [Tardiphaga sp.]|nr:sulfurtransferase TusA family protein [Tardiphaga sp.]